MKKSKFFKSLSVIIAVVMMMAVMVPTMLSASAANAEGYGITLPEKTGVRYDIYRVATCEVDKGIDKYTVADNYKSVLKVDNQGRLMYIGDTDILLDKSMEDEIGNDNNTLDKIVKALVAAQKDKSDSALVSNVSGGTETTDEGITAGYYLIIPKGSGVHQPILVSLTEETKTVTVDNTKSADIPFSKVITGVADNNGSLPAGGKGKTAEAIPGATINFKITTKMPTYNEGTTELKNDFTISDNPDEYFEAINTESGITVKVGSESSVVAGDNTYTVAASGDNSNGFTITFVDSYVLAHKGESVEITYSAKLKDTLNYVEEVSTNSNTATLSYDNDWYGNAPKATTADDTTHVYAVELNIQKNDESGSGLDGVEFTIYKEGAGDYSEAVGSERTTTGGGKITITDLPAGDYQIRETKTPTGYQTIDPIDFTITADVDGQEFDGSYTLTQFTGDNNTLTIVNYKGHVLPGTGGMGTVIFTVAGLATIVLAGVMLAVYMRKRKNED